MFALGYLFINNYKLWITTPVYTIDMNHDYASNLSYYEACLYKKYYNNSFTYVNLLKDDNFKYLLKMDKFNKPTKETDKIEYQSFLDRKDQQMPLWKLSKGNVELLINRCIELA